jgi:hypothetical protein
MPAQLPVDRGEWNAVHCILDHPVAIDHRAIEIMGNGDRKHVGKFVGGRDHRCLTAKSIGREPACSGVSNGIRRSDAQESARAIWPGEQPRVVDHAVADDGDRGRHSGRAKSTFQDRRQLPVIDSHLVTAHPEFLP